MTTEEKAKAYDKAIEKLREIITMDNKPVTPKEIGEYLFPELAESDDERIINNIKKVIGWYRGMFTEKSLMPEEYQEINAWLEKQGRTPPVLSNSSNTGKFSWNEEDEKMSKKVETAIDSYYAPFSRDAEEISEWFKNLKDRVQIQPKQEWSKEDKEIIDYLIDYLESELDSSYTDLDKETFTKEIKLLKSLRPQSQWKPTDEQIETLSHMIESVESEWDYEETIGRELLKQLKDLMEK